MENYKTKTLKVNSQPFDVVVSEETGKIWLTIDQIANLVGRSRSTVLRHIQSTYIEIQKSKDQIMSLSVTNCVKMTSVNGKIYKNPLNIYSIELVKELSKKINPELSVSLNIAELSDNSAMNSDNNIIIYDNGNIHLNIKFSPEEDTVWLTQAQIAELFETSRSNVSKHIKNIVDEGELNIDSICEYFSHMVPGNREYQSLFYNLDLVLAVGYRVKGKRAIEFRRWVSNIVKEYLIKGYTIDENRAVVSEDNFNKLKTRVELLEYETSQFRREIELMNNYEVHYFKAGQKYDSFDYLCSIVSNAQIKVIIIDPFFDDRGLSILSKTKNVKRIVYLSHRKLLTKIGLANFREQYGDVEIKDLKKFHDRFIIIDDKECYFIGSSLNYAGSKSFAIVKIEEEKTIKEIVDSI